MTQGTDGSGHVVYGDGQNRRQPSNLPCTQKVNLAKEALETQNLQSTAANPKDIVLTDKPVAVMDVDGLKDTPVLPTAVPAAVPAAAPAALAELDFGAEENYDGLW